MTVHDLPDLITDRDKQLFGGAESIRHADTFAVGIVIVFPSYRRGIYLETKQASKNHAL